MRVGQCFIAMSICLALAGGARADVIVSLDSYQYLSGDGLWEYTYSIDNQTGPDYVYYFDLDPVDGATIQSYPSGWSDISQDSSIGGFVSWSPTSSTDWIAPGATPPLSGFVIRSSYGPATGYVVWDLYTDHDGDPGTTDDIAYAYGDIEGPHVPEPATLALLLVGAGAVAVWRRRSVRSS